MEAAASFIAADERAKLAEFIIHGAINQTHVCATPRLNPATPRFRGRKRGGFVFSRGKPISVDAEANETRKKSELRTG